MTNDRLHRQMAQRIRRLARRLQLVATIRRGLWYFADPYGCQMSGRFGLDDQEAMEYLIHARDYA